MTEAAFLAQVLALARLYRWRCFHARPARAARGWRTPVQGDGAGFPDLLLLRGPAIVAAELKVGRGRPTAGQGAWLAALGRAGVPAYVWRPDDWDEILEVLCG